MIDFYVINLKERTDRKNEIIETFKNYQDINLIFVDAIRHENGPIGCFLSHKKCIQIAKDLNLKNIVVIEDDCLLLENFYERFINIKKFLDSKNDWKLFLGGATHCKKLLYKIKDSIEDLYFANNLATSHFMIYNNTCYDFFLNFDETKSPVDRCWNNKMDAIIPVPYLATQRKSYSDIAKCRNITIFRMINANNQFLINETNKPEFTVPTIELN